MWDGHVGATGEWQVDRVVLGVGAAIALVAAVVVLLTQGYASSDGDEKRPTSMGRTPATQVYAGAALDQPLLSPTPFLPNSTRPVLPAPGSSSGRITTVSGARALSGGQAYSFTGSAPAAAIPTGGGCGGSLLGGVIGLLSSLLGGSSSC